MKTLRVCLASELPDELDRSPEFLYFAYDKLYLYSGQNYLEDNFAIVDAIPEDPVYGMLYILNTDGSVHRIIDYTDIKIAEIEDASQISLLQKAGTMFYINARHRYIDSQRRVLTLPFTDGTYELNASTKNETVYDENTILKYNPETDRFEVYGDTAEDFIDYSKPFRGSTTNSAEIKVDGPRIVANVRLSETENNLLKATSDGLYIDANGCVSKTEFDQWVNDVFDMKTTSEELMRRVKEELDGLEEIITPEYINSKIHQELVAKYSTIDTALANYETYVANLSTIENNLITYAAENIIGARDQILQKVTNYQALEDLDNSATTFTHEIDYYEKAEEFYYPPAILSLGNRNLRSVSEPEESETEEAEEEILEELPEEEPKVEEEISEPEESEDEVEETDEKSEENEDLDLESITSTEDSDEEDSEK